ncbi:MAG: hypothetical protein V4467_01765 [Patescibacteria group bacterium]
MNYPTNLIEIIGAVTLPRVPYFLAREGFQEEHSVRSVRFALFGQNFKVLIRDYVEENVPAMRIKAGKLLDRATNDEISAALGRGTRTVPLAHIFGLLALQPSGEVPDPTIDRFLVVHEHAENIFHLKGTDWAIRAEQEGGGWHLGANRISQHQPRHQDGGVTGDRVFFDATEPVRESSKGFC